MNNEKNLSDICENVIKQAMLENEQISDNQINWVMNGSTVCNVLCNVKRIDDMIVSDKFTKEAKTFVRAPKGDLDISYAENFRFKINLSSSSVIEYQKISKEQRTYNFVDHNNILDDNEISQICKMETNSGLIFLVKKPQYIFAYKLRELVAKNIGLIFQNKFEEIDNNNILRDSIILYNIASEYCSKKEIIDVIFELYKISSILKGIKEENNEQYEKIINNMLDFFKLTQYSNRIFLSKGI